MKLTVFKKLVVGFLLVNILIFGICYYSLANLANMNETISVLYDRHLKGIEYIKTAQVDLYTIIRNRNVNGHLKNSIFGHKKTSNFGHEKPAVIQNLSLAITVEELPRRQWSVAERLLGNSHSLSPVKLTCSYCYLSSWLY